MHHERRILWHRTAATPIVWGGVDKDVLEGHDDGQWRGNGGDWAGRSAAAHRLLLSR